MNKKGFTLVEVVTTIILLSVLGVLIIPPVNNAIKKGKNKTYEAQIEGLKMSLQMFEKDNAINDSVKLTLNQLKAMGYVDKNIKNPKTNEILSNDTELIINKDNNKSNYEVNIIGDNKKEYNLLPTFNLKGDLITYVEINTPYNDLGVESKYNDTVLNTTMFGSVNTNLLGTYYLKYTANDTSIYRTVIVRDTIGPKIEFTNILNMTYDASINYDFKGDVTVTDNSNKNTTLEVTHNIKPIPGKYTIKYVAKDESNNETIRTREITIKE